VTDSEEITSNGDFMENISVRKRNKLIKEGTVKINKAILALRIFSLIFIFKRGRK
jgi:hypothetical protein